MQFKVLPPQYAIYRLAPTVDIPENLLSASFVSITRSPDELTVVCEEGLCGVYDELEAGWRCLRLEGSFSFDTIGVIASISFVLAQARVSLYVVSTYATDFILVKDSRLREAIDALVEAGHQVNDGDD